MVPTGTSGDLNIVMFLNLNIVIFLNIQYVHFPIISNGANNDMMADIQNRIFRAIMGYPLI